MSEQSPKTEPLAASGIIGSHRENPILLRIQFVTGRPTTGITIFCAGNALQEVNKAVDLVEFFEEIMHLNLRYLTGIGVLTRRATLADLQIAQKQTLQELKDAGQFDSSNCSPEDLERLFDQLARDYLGILTGIGAVTGLVMPADLQNAQKQAFQQMKDAGLFDSSVSSPEDLLAAQSQSSTDIKEAPQQEENCFYLNTDSWSMTYAREKLTVPSAPTNGVRAIAYLLKVGTPKDGPWEVRTVMSPPDPDEAPQKIGGDPEDLGIADEEARNEYQEKLKEAEGALRQDDDGEIQLGDRERKKIEEEVAWLRRELGRSVSKGGRPRRVNRDAKTVGEAINRTLKQIEKIHPKLHAHLAKFIKDRYGQGLRYEPDPPTHWIVDM